MIQKYFYSLAAQLMNILNRFIKIFKCFVIKLCKNAVSKEIHQNEIECL